MRDSVTRNSQETAPGESCDSDDGYGFLLDERLLSTVENLQLALACYYDMETVDPREPKQYASALMQLATVAENSQLLGLSDIAVRLSERAEASAEKGVSAVFEMREILSAFALAALDYLAEPGSGSFHDALLACIGPLPEGEDEIIRLMLGSIPSAADSEFPLGTAEAGIDSTGPHSEEGNRDESEVPFEESGEAAEIMAAEANQDVPAWAAESGAHAGAGDYTEGREYAAASETSDDVQHVDSSVLQLLEEEFDSTLQMFSDLVAQAVGAASDEERQEVTEACVSEIEGLARGAEVAGMEALARLLQLVKERTAGLDSRFRWHAAYSALNEFPARLMAYLHEPTSPYAASALVTVVQDFAWRSPVGEGAGVTLAGALTRVEIGAGASSGEARPVIAEAEDVSLALPDDLHAELLEGLLSELPVQTAAFAQAIRHIADDRGTREDIETAKRAAHTLKGAANTVGVRGIANLTHHLEDILLALSEHEAFPNIGLAQTLSYASDCLEAMSEALTGVGDPPDDAVKVLQDVLNWANRIDTQGIAVARGDGPEALAKEDPAESEAPAHASREQVPMMRVPAHLVDELLRLVGETMTTAAQLQNRLAMAVQQARAVSDQNALFRKLAGELETLVDLRGVSLPGKNPSQPTAGSDFDALELEQYNELQTLSRQLNEVATDSREMGLVQEENLTALGELLEQQGQLHLENQHAVMSTRMVPVSTVVSRLQRSVRQAGRILDKQVELRVGGEDTVMDGNLLHELVDPLMHLLRNAVDHGIESEIERSAAGKPPSGHIELLFRREGDYIIVHCSDDGRGLDLAAIRQLAEERGFIPPGLPLSDEEVARLILIPGFSTREEATQVSGRGIGMDAVNAKVSAFKGSLKLHSEWGAGLSIEIRLPVTLLSAHALLVRVRDRTMALSTRGIEDVHYAAPEQIGYEDEKSFYTLGDKRHEIIDLEQLLSLPGDRRKSARFAGRAVLIVRLETGTERAVAVQEILESRSLVIKTLGPYVPKITGIIGATILGDGGVAPVIDIPDLLYAPAYGHLPSIAPEYHAAESVEGAGGRKALVVDDSVSARRFAAQIMRDAGYDVRTANDGLDAVAILDSFVPDIVLTDMEMPRMNGFELARHVRAQERTRHAPVVMITSRATEKHRRQAELAGVSLYVTKPFNEYWLIDQIRRLAENRESDTSAEGNARGTEALQL